MHLQQRPGVGRLSLRKKKSLGYFWTSDFSGLAGGTSFNFPKSLLRVSPKQTPITTDKDLLEKILTIQPDIFEVYKKLSYDELKEVLNKYLTPSSTPSSSSETSSGGDDEEWGTAKVAATKPSTSKSTKQQIDQEFDEIFNKS